MNKPCKTAIKSKSCAKIVFVPHNQFIVIFSGRISNVKSISSTHSTVSSLPSSSSIRDLTTTNRSSAGGGASTATSMHLSTSKQEPLTSIVVIKTEAGSISSGNLIGVSDEVILHLHSRKIQFKVCSIIILRNIFFSWSISNRLVYFPGWLQHR